MRARGNKPGKAGNLFGEVPLDVPWAGCDHLDCVPGCDFSKHHCERLAQAFKRAGYAPASGQTGKSGPPGYYDEQTPPVTDPARTEVWVVYSTSDYEGCSPPAGVYASKEAAERVKAEISGSEPQMVEVEEFEIDAPPRPYR